jgi:hypothetical protein
MACRNLLLQPVQLPAVLLLRLPTSPHQAPQVLQVVQQQVVLPA